MLDYLNLKWPDKSMAINRSNELGYSIKEINTALNLKRKIYEGIDQSTSFFVGKISIPINMTSVMVNSTICMFSDLSK